MSESSVCARGIRSAWAKWFDQAPVPCVVCPGFSVNHGVGLQQQGLRHLNPEIAGGPPGSPNEDGDRYIEIWNNVFMSEDDYAAKYEEYGDDFTAYMAGAAVRAGFKGLYLD